MNLFSARKLTGEATRKSSSAFAAVIGPNIVQVMLDPRRGKTLRMYECRCGERFAIMGPLPALSQVANSRPSAGIDCCQWHHSGINPILSGSRRTLKRTWTIIGVVDVSQSFKWYQSRLDLPETAPATTTSGRSSSDGTVLLCLHKRGAHEHPTLTIPTTPRLATASSCSSGSTILT